MNYVKSNETFCYIFLYGAILRGNHPGGCEYNDLQNWFVWRHMKTLYW